MRYSNLSTLKTFYLIAHLNARWLIRLPTDLVLMVDGRRMMVVGLVVLTLLPRPQHHRAPARGRRPPQRFTVTPLIIIVRTTPSVPQDAPAGQHTLRSKDSGDKEGGNDASTPPCFHKDQEDREDQDRIQQDLVILLAMCDRHRLRSSIILSKEQ